MESLNVNTTSKGYFSNLKNTQYSPNETDLTDSSTRSKESISPNSLDSSGQSFNGQPYLETTQKNKLVVCKHWLRGQCRNGDKCQYLHEMDSNKIPPCYYFTKFGKCAKADCKFLHKIPTKKVDKTVSIKEQACPYYSKGFCKFGPKCPKPHVQKLLCVNFLCGFCPNGPNCNYKHLKFEQPKGRLTSNGEFREVTFCHYCKDEKHKVTACPELELFIKKDYSATFTTTTTNNTCPEMIVGDNSNLGRRFRPLDQVTCFKCRETGHYANKCPYISL